MTLYDIDQSLAALMEAVDPETGEWVADPVAWEELNLERDKKIENTALVIKNIDIELQNYKAVIEKQKEFWAHRMNSLRCKKEWLEGELKRSLNGERFETPLCTVRFVKNNPKLNVVDEAAVMAWAREYAPDCLSYKPATLKVNDLKEKLKRGAEIPGAELVRETRMEVK